MGGDILHHWTFFIFKYDNKHDVLIPKTSFNVTYAFWLRSYGHFETSFKSYIRFFVKKL